MQRTAMWMGSGTMGCSTTMPSGEEQGVPTLTRAQVSHRPPSHAERVERWQPRAFAEQPRMPVGPCGGLMLGSGDGLTVHGASRRRWPCSPESYASSEHTGGRGASTPPRVIVNMTEPMGPSGCSGKTASTHIPAEHNQEQEPERKKEPAPRTGGYGRSRGNMLGSGN